MLNIEEVISLQNTFKWKTCQMLLDRILTLLRSTSEIPLTSVGPGLESLCKCTYVHTQSLQKMCLKRMLCPSCTKMKSWLQNFGSPHGNRWKSYEKAAQQNWLPIRASGLTVMRESVLQCISISLSLFTNLVFPIWLPIFLAFKCFPVSWHIHVFLKATQFFFRASKNNSTFLFYALEIKKWFFWD